MSVGTKIRKLRLQNRWSQEELANKLNIAQTSVSNFEAEKTVPDFVVMQKLCDVFEVDFEYFLEQKPIFKIKKNTGVAVGDNNVINIQAPEGVLESMLKRIAALEEKLDKK